MNKEIKKNSIVFSAPIILGILIVTILGILTAIILGILTAIIFEDWIYRLIAMVISSIILSRFYVFGLSYITSKGGKLKLKH